MFNKYQFRFQLATQIVHVLSGLAVGFLAQRWFGFKLVIVLCLFYILIKTDFYTRTIRDVIHYYLENK